MAYGRNGCSTVLQGARVQNIYHRLFCRRLSLDFAYLYSLISVNKRVQVGINLSLTRRNRGLLQASVWLAYVLT